MARLLPLRSEPDRPDSGPRVLDLDDAETDEVFSALSSDTARDIYRAIHEEPSPPSDIADRIDSSIQNVRYHLENLEEAGLIEVVDTWYSSRGNEMSVYAPSSDALVLAADEDHASRLRTALSRLLGGVVILAMASLAVQQTVTELLGNPVSSDTAGSEPTGGGDGGAGGDGEEFDAGGGDGGDAAGAPETDATEAPSTPESGSTPEPEPSGTAAPEPTATDGGGIQAQDQSTTVQAAQDTEAESLSRESTTVDNETAMETTGTVADAAANGADAAANLPPGALFFAGGLAVLVAVVAYWYWAGR